MGNYLFSHYKGVYRVEAQYDENTNDVPRDKNNNILKSYDDTYIACKSGNMIFHYGGNKLTAYIPSIKRGKRIIRELIDIGVQISNVIETDCEIEFRFSAKDISIIAEKLGAKTHGANTSPYSVKRLKVDKNVSIPMNKIKEYKEITSCISQGDKLVIHRITQRFLTDVLVKKYKLQNVLSDMKQLNLARKTKEYIYVKEMWDEYIEYLRKELGGYGK